MVFVSPGRLIQALKNAGFSQKRIAELSGSSESQISRILNGDRGTTLDLYMALYALWEKCIQEEKRDGE